MGDGMPYSDDYVDRLRSRFRVGGPDLPQRATADLAGFGTPAEDRPQQAIEASDWRPVVRGTLQGFVHIHTPSGWTFRDCAYHIKGDARWISLPARAQIDEEGRQRVDPRTGKRLYSTIIDLDPERRAAFQEQALEALDRLLEETQERERSRQSLSNSARISRSFACQPPSAPDRIAKARICPWYRP